MNKEKKFFLKCLNAAIRGLKVKISKEEKDILLKDIVCMAKTQDVAGLIYSSISKTEYVDTQDKNRIEEFKRAVVFSNLNQIKFINEVKKLIKALDCSGKDIILLKGLVLRNYYPRAEYRTMGDVDILVRREEFDCIKDILECNQWKELEPEIKEGINITFMNKDGYHLELHNRLIHTGHYKGSVDFDNYVWKNIIKIDDYSNIYSLGETDFLLHICTHMGFHQKYNGFGVRYLCDLVFFIENNLEKVDWKFFNEEIKFQGLTKFTYFIFKVCESVFNMRVPDALEGEFYFDDGYIDNFMDNMIDIGVHGKEDSVRIMKKAKGNLFFPLASNLSDKYEYAKEYKILLPIAWLHRGIMGIIGKKFNVNSIVKYLRYDRNKVDKEIKLNDLLEL